MSYRRMSPQSHVRDIPAPPSRSIVPDLQHGQRKMGALRGAIIPVTPFEQNCAILWDDATKQAVVVDPGRRRRPHPRRHRPGRRLRRAHLAHPRPSGPRRRRARSCRRRSGEAAIPAIERPRSARRIPAPGPGGARPRLRLRHAQRHAGPLAARGRQRHPRRSTASTSCTAPDTRRATSCSSTTPRASPLLGDVLFQGSVGRTDFPYGDHAALISAITGKLLPLGDDFSFLCGHGPGSTLGEERRSNPFLRGGT